MTTATTYGGLLGVESCRPCSKIPPGVSGRAVSFRPAQSGHFCQSSLGNFTFPCRFGSIRSLAHQTTTIATSGGSLRSRKPSTLQQNTIGSHCCDVRPETCLIGYVPGRALFCLIFLGLYGSTRDYSH
ncbi:hypothetical protein CRG98_021521 [Punica granatum]|uniref:Uncharacterized protein n=1 Tax=Punica granatum TaxID=22663 RepID=A0A2I0JP77_PUNGR|nr:hypothetical protein CRG98_021521 [Punica granatum]